MEGYSTVQEMATKWHMNPSMVQYYVRIGRVDAIKNNNRLWIKDDAEKPTRKELERHYGRRAVECITTGETFHSINSAARVCEVSAGNLWEVCEGRRISAGGLRFRYVDEKQ